MRMRRQFLMHRIKNLFIPADNNLYIESFNDLTNDQTNIQGHLFYNVTGSTKIKHIPFITPIFSDINPPKNDILNIHKEKDDKKGGKKDSDSEKEDSKKEDKKKKDKKSEGFPEGSVSGSSVSLPSFSDKEQYFEEQPHLTVYCDIIYHQCYLEEKYLDYLKNFKFKIRDLKIILRKIEFHGQEILQPKQLIREYKYFTHMLKENLLYVGGMGSSMSDIEQYIIVNTEYGTNIYSIKEYISYLQSDLTGNSDPNILETLTNLEPFYKQSLEKSIQDSYFLLPLSPLPLRCVFIRELTQSSLVMDLR